MLLKRRRKLFVSHIYFFLGLLIILAGFGLSGSNVILAADNSKAVMVAVKGILPEKDLIEAFCLNSQWRARDFLAWVQVYDNFTASSSEKFFKTNQNHIFPDSEQFQKESEVKLLTICTSTSYSTALENFQNLAALEKSVQSELRNVDVILKTYFQEQIDLQKARISPINKAELKNLISQEKAKKEKELKRLAEQMVKLAEQNLKTIISGKKFSDFQEAQNYAAFITKQQQKDISEQLTRMSYQMQAELKQQADSLATNFLKKQNSGFNEILQELQQTHSELLSAYEKKIKANEKLKTKALEKRKNLIMVLLDKELTSFKNQGIVQNQTIIRQLNELRQTFLDKAQAAVKASDSNGLKKAIEGAQASWQEARSAMPEVKLSSENVELICSSTSAFIANIKPQLENLTQKIQSISNTATERAKVCRAHQERKGCLTFNTLINHLTSLESDAKNFSDLLANLENQCNDQKGNTKNNILKTINLVQKSGLKLQADWADWKNQWPQYQEAI
ncbi:hypothetical protein COT20_01385 [bacterium (Candidatus Gribaldobacteria) CG08_land_8_20_14_0_20_39_15]|uniref:Uncharacterized protein n=1 Tax=bacterium (Candidatus Gribaldobacteria) CG08_land_8_20_14_0_20_39_15 TaxID=2014273 RepID=A0A2M6XUV2_9BACT|nr:MAG: hypothetical protein COT20_01385 [bacterium (Candidatus Gribaldobacteria) CG08_land_8_20_14_0_20_39_15]